MANSSDWMAQAGKAPAAKPGWIAALALDTRGDGGFRAGSPFGAQASLPVGDLAQNAPDTRDNALEMARSDGFAQGYAEADRLAKAALAENQEQFRRLRLGFQQMDASAREALASDLEATVHALCAQVLGDYALDQAALVTRCAAAAEKLGAGPADLTLHLNPETRASLDDAALASWTVVEDATLAPGALRLTSADGAVRDGPEDWARAIAEALEG
ncbi:MAG: FliH/SctL family protein [Erythrobacter sp.]